MRAQPENKQKVLAFLREQLARGTVPSVREIGARCGIRSTSTVQTCLDQLEQEGVIRRTSGLNRSIRLAEDQPLAKVPLLGRVTAGAPILAVQEVEGYVGYSAPGADPGELFALRVRGDSMVGAGILNGDIVIVRRTAAARDGDIIVALIGDEATVKRFFREADGFRLQPENDAFSPIYVKEVSVLGRVVALQRELA
ncbi:MAG: transcriptional repressor LexA [Clostridia bacterium]|nr:transcriptional repressor LexA [Clostridia bacterium]